MALQHSTAYGNFCYQKISETHAALIN